MNSPAVASTVTSGVRKSKPDAVPNRPVQPLSAAQLTELEGMLLEHRTARRAQLTSLGLPEAREHISPRALERATTVARAVLQQVEASLDRIADGTYGWCRGCLAELDVERLRTAPYLAYCARCTRLG